MLRQMRFTATAMLFALSPISIQAVHADNDAADPTILTFSTVGDSRQDSNPDKADPTTQPVPAQDQVWHQNTKAWSRIIRTVEKQKSDFLFFNGDMIMGYGNADVPTDTSSVDSIVSSDLVRMNREYAFWRGMVADMMETGTYVVPVPGNHEVQCKTCPDGSKKKAQVVNENAWRANMGDLILDNDRMANMFGAAPAFENVSNNGPVDGLTTDQSQLSYSFDFRDSHFVVINTDPVGNDAHAPVTWLNNDLAAAQARGMKHMFVFGHKPAFTYYFGADPAAPNPDHPAGLDNDTASRGDDGVNQILAGRPGCAPRAQETSPRRLPFQPLRLRSLPGNRQLSYLDRRAANRSPEIEVVSHRLNVIQNLLQVARDRDLGNWEDDLPVLHPKPEGSPRKVSGDRIEPVSYGSGEQKSAIGRGNDLLRRLRAREEIEIVRTHTASIGVPRRRNPQFAAGITVAEKTAKDAALDDRGLAAGDAFGVERPRAESCRHQAVIDDGDVPAADRRSQSLGQKGGFLIDGDS